MCSDAGPTLGCRLSGARCATHSAPVQRASRARPRARPAAFPGHMRLPERHAGARPPHASLQKPPPGCTEPAANKGPKQARRASAGAARTCAAGRTGLRTRWARSRPRTGRPGCPGGLQPPPGCPPACAAARLRPARDGARVSWIAAMWELLSRDAHGGAQQVTPSCEEPWRALPIIAARHLGSASFRNSHKERA